MTDDPELAHVLDVLGFGVEAMERRAMQAAQAQRARYGAAGFDIIGVRDRTPPDGGEAA